MAVSISILVPNIVTFEWLLRAAFVGGEIRGSVLEPARTVSNERCPVSVFCVQLRPRWCYGPYRARRFRQSSHRETATREN